jgi:hypothetical protein
MTGIIESFFRSDVMREGCRLRLSSTMVLR